MLAIDDRAYCLAYPDVAAAIAAGSIPSADVHHRRCGRFEIQTGQRRSPFILSAPPGLALPVIVAILGCATVSCPLPWGFLSVDEKALVQEFATVLFEGVYAGRFADVRERLARGDLPSAFAHWLECGRPEITDGTRSVDDIHFDASDHTGGSAGLRALVGGVADWGALIQCCSRRIDYRAASLNVDAETSSGGHALRALAQARTRRSDVAIGEQLHPVRSPDCAPRIVAFYLPQYHAIPENDAWWGRGFTEWTNVRNARPNFDGHRQPHVPLNHEYYDLTDVSVQRRQAALAREYGLAAFCYHVYWFGGHRLLERPLDQMVADGGIDFEFCLCWANENWTRTWDGRANDVLIGQTHTPDTDRRFILDMLRYLADPRYLRVGGKLVLLVYRVDLLPDCRTTAALWRDEVRRAGLGELHLCAVQFYGVTDPEPWGFDAAVEFPPHGWLVEENLLAAPPAGLDPEFQGTVLDYAKSVQWALSRPYPNYIWYRTAFPGWDNTARRQDTPHIFAHSNPLAFEAWLTGIIRQTIIMAPAKHQLVFINAWNEWGEGAHLEPDEDLGSLNLMAVNAALNAAKREAWPLSVLARLRKPGDYAGRSGDELALLNLLRASENALGALTAQLRATGINPFE